MLLPWTMFHGLQCTVVNPFVAGSSVLFTFIEIMETICEKASSFNNINGVGFYGLIKLRFWMGQNAGYFDKASQGYYFFTKREGK